MKVKKFLVLAILFMLPITVYIFFASGVNNFVKLPILTPQINELGSFKTIEGNQVELANKITVLCFFGNDLEAKKANAFNLAHKIYKKNYQFNEFQFVVLISEGMETQAQQLKNKLAEIENPENWNFAVGTSEDIKGIFKSLNSNDILDPKLSTDTVFIIDKERGLRGRDDDEDVGLLYGYNASDYAEVNNKMSDDIKVILAEYRLALKKYKTDREI